MAEFERKVRIIMRDNGCYFVRPGKGDHEIWFSPITERCITVDKKIKSRFTANAILKQSGIQYKSELRNLILALSLSGF